MKRLSIVCLAFVLVIAFGFTSAFAQPSSKVTFKASRISVVPVTTESLDGNPDAGWVNIWDSPMLVKTPSDKDLVMSFSAECGLVTDTTVMSKNLEKVVANAEAMIEIRVLVDGEAVQVGKEIINPDTKEVVRDGASVIFARRYQELIAQFGGGFTSCYDEDTGTYIITDACLDYESLQLILSTMNANSFDFVAPDLAPIVHEIMVQARLTYNNTELQTVINSDDYTEPLTTAFLGYSSFTIDTVRMVKNAEPVELQ